VEVLNYSDGEARYVFSFRDGELHGINRRELCSLNQDSVIFATAFQFFFLRLAIFFGCVGIFMNLFRGEMIDKSLHFYLLAPMRREVLLVGKYLAGLIATVVIFTGSTALQLLIFVMHFNSSVRAEYMNGPGWGQIGAYLGVTALACLGYGSVFLAAGLLFRNPIIPAAAVLLWENINPFLPAALKKISVIFYLQSLCPVVAPPNRDMSPVLALLISNAEPTPAVLAVGGLILVTVLVLAIAAQRVRKLEINYGTD
jgi:ABC-type transport system involved in multi-copper enzyme maturation permease subunit